LKPGDHPEFFRIAPPPGTSRESTIRLDRDGRFWHDGALVENEALSRALHTWIARHPDDGRYILTNGYDWTYFQVDDVPYLVTSVSVEGDRVALTLSDGTSEPMGIEGLEAGRDGALYVRVKGGAFEARFTRHAQTSLAPVTDEDGGQVVLRIGGRVATPAPRA
jgi:hypothetical protein